MDLQNKTSVMNQEIFKIGLPVETVSVYLLCCGFADADTVISIKNLLKVWNSTGEVLADGIEKLEQMNVLSRIISDGEGNNIYKLAEIKEWGPT